MHLAKIRRPAPGRETFLLILIKPSHYDDDGYVIQWARNDIPSNTLATLFGISLDWRRVLRATLRLPPLTRPTPESDASAQWPRGLRSWACSPINFHA